MTTILCGNKLGLLAQNVNLHPVGQLTPDDSEFIFFASNKMMAIRIYILHDLGWQCHKKDDVVIPRNTTISESYWCGVDGEILFATKRTYPSKPENDCDHEYCSFLECSDTKAIRADTVQLIRDPPFKEVVEIKLYPSFNVSIEHPTSNGRRKHNAKASFAICSPPLRKWTQQSVLESWLMYHFRNGCESIALLMCGSPEELKPPLFMNKFIDMGNVFVESVCPEHFEDPGRNFQIYSANWCIDRYSGVVDWVAVIDPDEFISIPTEKPSWRRKSQPTISNLLSKHKNVEVGALMLRHRFMGPCTGKQTPVGVDPREYFKTAYPFSPRGHRTKMIYSTALAVFAGVHGAVEVHGRVVDLNEEQDLFLSHYYCAERPRNLTVPEYE